MIVITSEYDNFIFKLDETRDIVENTHEDCGQKYNANCRTEEVICVVEFLDEKN